jgi:hypothetical protein
VVSGAQLRLQPLTNITCFYDPQYGMLTGVKYMRKASIGGWRTESSCDCTSPMYSTITLPKRTYVTAVHYTYTDKSVLNVRFLLSNGAERTCNAMQVATPDKLLRLPRSTQGWRGPYWYFNKNASKNGISKAAAASYISSAMSLGTFRGKIPFYSELKGRSICNHRIFVGPKLYGGDSCLTRIPAKCDPRSR